MSGASPGMAWILDSVCREETFRTYISVLRYSGCVTISGHTLSLCQGYLGGELGPCGAVYSWLPLHRNTPGQSCTNGKGCRRNVTSGQGCSMSPLALDIPEFLSCQLPSPAVHLGGCEPWGASVRHPLPCTSFLTPPLLAPVLFPL